MLRNLDTIYYITRSSKNFSTEINFSENIFLFCTNFFRSEEVYLKVSLRKFKKIGRGNQKLFLFEDFPN